MLLNSGHNYKEGKKLFNLHIPSGVKKYFYVFTYFKLCKNCNIIKKHVIFLRINLNGRSTDKSPSETFRQQSRHVKGDLKLFAGIGQKKF